MKKIIVGLATSTRGAFRWLRDPHIGQAFQTLAAIATILAVGIAGQQYFSAEADVRERQKGLAIAAASRCANTASIMDNVAVMDHGDGIFRKSLDALRTGDEIALSDIPLTEMPSARAVSDLLFCRSMAKWYAEVESHEAGRVTMCANAVGMRRAADSLLAESENPGRRRTAERLENQDILGACSKKVRDAANEREAETDEPKGG